MSRAAPGRLPDGVVAGVVAIAVLAVLLALFPFLASRGVDIPEQLAYGQTVAACATVVVAAGLGLYTVRQVQLARSSLQGDIEARRAQEEAHVAAVRSTERQVLMALLGELLANLKIAEQHEKRVWVEPLARDPSLWLFRFTTYRALVAGPMWQLPRDTPVWVPVLAAYGALETLSLEISPIDWRTWFALVQAFASVAGTVGGRLVWGGGLVGYDSGLPLHRALKNRCSGARDTGEW